MNVLMAPRWQHVGVPQSLALLPLEFARDLMRLDETMSVTFAVPESATFDELDGFFGPVLEETAERVIWCPAYRRMPVRLVGFAQNERLVRAADIADVVLTNQLGGIAGLRTATDKPIVGWHLWSASERAVILGTGMAWGEQDVAWEALSTLFADVNVFESEHMLNETRTALRRYCRAEVVQGALAKAVVAVNGVKLTEPKQGDVPTIAWGGNQTVMKGMEESLEVLSKVEAMMTQKIRVIVCSGTEIDRAKLPSHWEVRVAGPEEWREICSESHVVVCNSKTESYGVAWLEALGAGAAVVYQEAWWVLSGLTVPPGWPFVRDSVVEQAEVCAMLLRRPAIRNGFTENARRWVAEMHSRKVGVEAMYEAIGDAPDRRPEA